MRKPCTAWNKGSLPGQKPPLKPKEIWSLRIRLQVVLVEREDDVGFTDQLAGPAVEAAVQKAAGVAAQTCDLCGASGVLRTDLPLRVRCDRHSNTDVS